MVPEPDLSRTFRLGSYLIGGFHLWAGSRREERSLSFIRLIDRIVRVAQGSEVPEQMAPFVYNFNLVIC